MKLTTALRNTIVSNIITAAGTNPKLKYYTGTESLTPAGTLLATLTVTGALGTASSGVIDFNETVTQTNASHVASRDRCASRDRNIDAGCNRAGKGRIRTDSQRADSRIG